MLFGSISIAALMLKFCWVRGKALIFALVWSHPGIPVEDVTLEIEGLAFGGS
jgi:hypothetical protein